MPSNVVQVSNLGRDRDHAEIAGELASGKWMPRERCDGVDGVFRKSGSAQWAKLSPSCSSRFWDARLSIGGAVLVNRSCAVSEDPGRLVVASLCCKVSFLEQLAVQIRIGVFLDAVLIRLPSLGGFPQFCRHAREGAERGDNRGNDPHIHTSGYLVLKLPRILRPQNQSNK